MHTATMAVYNLGRRPLRTFLTILGIAVGISSFVAIVGLSRGVENAWIVNLNARGTHLLAVQKGAVELLTTSIDADLGPHISQIPGVAAVSGELGDMMTLEGKHTTVAVGWPFDSHLWNTLHLLEGKFPKPGDTRMLLLGQAAAQALQKRTGDILQLRDRTFTISGVFRMRGVMGNNAVIIPLEALQEMMQRPGKVTGFHIKVDSSEDPANISAARERLEKVFPNLTFLETSTAADNDLVLKLFRALAWSVSIVILIIALMIILNTLLMSVFERTREIGILSALGWSSSRLLGLFIMEGLVMVLIGTALGLALGIAGLEWLTTLPRVRGLIEPDISLALLGEVLIAAVMLGILGSIYPAYRASCTDPMESIRYE
jgi:putative ABC transport system permease protein